MSVLEQEEHFVPWGSWVREVIAAAETEGFLLSPEETQALIDRAVWIDGNERIN